MLYILLANGFEEIEALATVDIIRRAGIDIQMASVEGVRAVTGAHGISVMADCLIRRGDIEQSEGIILPGGMPGAETLRKNAAVRKLVQVMASKNALVAAICAAPMVLGDVGVLKGRKATCYPGFEKWLQGADYQEEAFVVEDGQFITAKGPGVTVPFALSIARRFVSEDTVNSVSQGMILPA